MGAAVQYKITNAFMFPLEMRHQQQSSKDIVLSKMDHELEKMVKQYILTRKDIQTFFQPRIEKLFDFRISSLNWLVKNQIPVTQLVKDLENALIQFKQNNTYSFLYQNIIYALQANIEGINHLMPTQQTVTQHPIQKWQPLPKLSIKEHLNLMHFMIQPLDVDLYEQWLIASLQIEFVILVAVFLSEQKLILNSLKINELSFFLIVATKQFKTISQKMKGASYPNILEDTESFSSASFLENSQAGILEETFFNRDEMIQKYKIDWTNLPQLQALFKDAPWEDMENI